MSAPTIEPKPSQDSSNLFEKLFEFSPDAVLVTDPFDELVLANESAARTFHFDLDRSRRAPDCHATSFVR